GPGPGPGADGVDGADGADGQDADEPAPTRLSPELEAILEEYPEPEDAESPAILPAIRQVMRDVAGTERAAEEGERTIGQARLITDFDPDGARRLLELVTEYGDPAQAAMAWDDIGDIHGDQDDMSKAVEAYRAGAAIDHPAALLPLRSLLIALMDVEEYDAVAEEAQRAVTTGDPETVAMGYWTWGDARRRRGDTDATVRLYRQGIAAGHPELTPRIRIDLAGALRDRGESGEARTELVQAKSEAPDALFRVRAGNFLGQWAYEDGDLAAAAEAFGEVGTVDPGDDERLEELVDMAAHNVIVIANNAYEAGDHGLAVRALTLAARAGKEADALRVAGKRASALADTGDRQAAVRYMEAAVAFRDDPGPKLELDLAGLFRSAGEIGRAKEIYQRLTEHFDTEIRLTAQGRLASLLREEGDTAGLSELSATTSTTSTTSTTPGEAGSEVDEGMQALIGGMLGILQSEQGDSDGALRTLRSAAASGEPMAMFALALELTKKGETAEARELYAKVAESEGTLAARAMVQYGNSFHDEDPAEARLWYMRALEAAGAGESEGDGIAVVLAKMYLGSLAKKVRDWPEALRWYQQVIDSGGRTGDTSQAPMAAAHLGELAYWMNDRDNTVRFYELTLAMGTEEAELIGEASFRLGEIAHREGDLDAARAHLGRAVESGWKSFVTDGQALLDRIDEGDSSL
ncbi:MAG: tetratricopeptide repeat protein, partial [Streptosporangiales bacterium]|nr:tetratricopeptide repeat protein [Streptosporangiales bacterium]